MVVCVSSISYVSKFCSILQRCSHVRRYKPCVCAFIRFCCVCVSREDWITDWGKSNYTSLAFFVIYFRSWRYMTLFVFTAIEQSATCWNRSGIWVNCKVCFHVLFDFATPRSSKASLTMCFMIFFLLVACGFPMETVLWGADLNNAVLWISAR